MLQKTKAVCRFFMPHSAADWIVYIVGGSAALTVFYWAWIDTEPIIVRSAETASEVVMQGQPFRLDYEVEWARSCEITSYRTITDAAGQIHSVEPEIRYVHEGPEEYVVSVPIALAAAPGPARYRSNVEFRCNPWQRWMAPLSRQIQDRAFSIVPGTPTAGGLSWIPSDRAAMCTAEQPVFVRAHCRRSPGTVVNRAPG